MPDLRLLLVFKLFARSIRLGRKRALLTVAAIAWGTVTILLLLGFGEGLKRQMSKNSQAMGENLAILWSGETSKPWKGLPIGRPIRPRIDDVAYLRERMPGATAVLGEAVSWRTALSYGPKTVNGRVVGTNWEYGEVRKHYPVAGGRFLHAVDEAEKRRVVFLGDELARDVFAREDPVGKTLLINNSPFTVIGVMQPKVQSGAYGGPDKSHAVIPLTTFKALFGRDQLGNLVVQVRHPEQMPAALRELHEALGARYGYDPADERVFPTWDTVKSSRTMRNILLGIELFLGVIGALTLLTGGVGVANIMYAVVKERTKEIGVKMALGARRGWITGPFVLEGMLYTLVGGAAGTAFATLLVKLIDLIPTEGNEVMSFLGKPTLSLPIGAATAAILGVMGMLAGYFPARRAAAVDPATTLRYE